MGPRRTSSRTVGSRSTLKFLGTLKRERFEVYKTKKKKTYKISIDSFFEKSFEVVIFTWFLFFSVKTNFVFGAQKNETIAFFLDLYII